MNSDRNLFISIFPSININMHMYIYTRIYLNHTIVDIDMCIYIYFKICITIYTIFLYLQMVYVCVYVHKRESFISALPHLHSTVLLTVTLLPNDQIHGFCELCLHSSGESAQTEGTQGTLHASSPLCFSLFSPFHYLS